MKEAMEACRSRPLRPRQVQLSACPEATEEDRALLDPQEVATFLKRLQIEGVDAARHYELAVSNVRHGTIRPSLLEALRQHRDPLLRKLDEAYRAELLVFEAELRAHDEAARDREAEEAA